MIPGSPQKMDPDIKSTLEPFQVDDIVSEDPQVHIDPRLERRLVWKCDLHVVPILMVLFLLAFLDRINIGNARLQGLEGDLNMSGNDYNIALFIFFIPYILCELPCNLVMKVLAPSTWISSIMAAWGIVTICQGFVQNRAGLIACRFFIGVFEAGFMPGCIYLISMYYKRYELQWRVTFFFSASILAGAVSGVLAYGLSYMEGVRGYSSWRWIFILEGIATVVVALISKFFIVDWPETARFLNESERVMLLARLQSGQGTYRMDRLDKTAGKRILWDSKIYLGTLMYLGVVNTGYAVSFFIPTILNDMGWTSLEAQVMSIPIYICAAVMTLCAALISDWLRHRWAFVVIGCLIATVGYIILLVQNLVPVGVRYFALFAITGGGYVAQPILVGWLSNNISGHYKQAIASASQIGFGNCGGLIASNIFLSSEAPLYHTGYGVSLALIWVCGFASLAFVLILRWENHQREEGKRDHLLNVEPGELDNMGDSHPHFRFTY